MKYTYKIIFPDGDAEIFDDEVFDSEDEAERAAMEAINDCRTGAEILYLSNPGDYPYSEEDDDDYDYEIVELE